MPNPIKYTTGSESNALKKGNFYIGTGDVGKGPSDTTGYYQGPNVPSGGYVIYLNKEGAPGGLSYHSAANDAQLIAFTNNLAGQSYTTVNECLVYFAGQTDKVVLNRDYEGIVTNGLVLNLDAGFTPSYPRSGTTWTDLSLSGNNGTLINGPTFDSDNGGSIVFDGVNDYSQKTSFSVINGTVDKSLEVWFKPTGIDSAPVVQSGTQGMVGLNFEIVYTVEGDTGGFTNIPAQYKNLGGIYGAFWARDIFIPISYNNSVKNNWHQAVFTLSGGNIGSLFHNGTLPQALKWSDPNWSQTLESQPFTFTSINTGSNQPIYIGRAATSSPWGQGQLYFPGNIAIVRVYNRALTAQEVLQNYNAQKGRFGL
jgi:hypothetical protein